VSHIIQLARDTVEDVSTILLLKKSFCQCCGMRLRPSPSDREYKERMRVSNIHIIELRSITSSFD
jgi:hypothetical protein